MIIIGGHKQLTNKILKEAVCNPDLDYIIYDGTGKSEYLKGRDVVESNAFQPESKVYKNTMNEVYAGRRLQERIEQAREEYLSNKFLLEDVLSVIQMYINADGKINVFIIVRQSAYDVIGKDLCKVFVDMCGNSEVAKTWSEIEDEWKSALMFIPSKDDLRKMSNSIEDAVSNYDIPKTAQGKKQKQRGYLQEYFEDMRNDRDRNTQSDKKEWEIPEKIKSRKEKIKLTTEGLVSADTDVIYEIDRLDRKVANVFGGKGRGLHFEDLLPEDNFSDNFGSSILNDFEFGEKKKKKKSKKKWINKLKV